MCMLCEKAAAAASFDLRHIPGDRTYEAAPSPLPDQGDYLIRDAYVISVDDKLGEIEAGAIHVRDGRIVAVGTHIEAPEAEIVDGRGMIAIPGLVDTHFHVWHTLLRSYAGTRLDTAFFPLITTFSKAMEPRDMASAARLSAAEAINSGLTTIHSWCHNVRSREHADAELKAFADMGIRARFSFGQAIAQTDDTPILLDDLAQLHGEWADFSAEGRLTLGMAWRGMYRNSWAPEEVYRTEFETARSLGLPISVHIGTQTSRIGHIRVHAEKGLLGPDVNVVHACSADAEEIAMLAQLGASVSVLSLSEMRAGWGMPLLSEFREAGIPTALGVDSVALTGNCHYLGLLKFAQAVENGKALDEHRFTARDMLRMGTLDAARVLGLDHEIGTLTPGKRADIVLVSTDAINMGLFTDPANMLVESCLPENISDVMVDGRFLKRNGAFTAWEAKEIIETARHSLADLRGRAGWV